MERDSNVTPENEDLLDLLDLLVGHLIFFIGLLLNFYPKPSFFFVQETHSECLRQLYAASNRLATLKNQLQKQAMAGIDVRISSYMGVYG